MFGAAGPAALFGSYGACGCQRLQNRISLLAGRYLCPHNPIRMQQEDDLRGLSKLMHLMRGVSLLLLFAHIYWFCYAWMEQLG